jgi:hypothetical protein
MHPHRRIVYRALAEQLLLASMIVGLATLVAWCAGWIP